MGKMGILGQNSHKNGNFFPLSIIPYQIFLEIALACVKRRR